MFQVSACTEYVCIRIPVQTTSEDPKSKTANSSTEKGDASKATAQRPKKDFPETASEEPQLPETGIAIPPISKQMPTDQGQIWIGHGRIVKVCRPNYDRGDDKVTVTFELTGSCLPVPKSLVDSSKVKGLVEIFVVPETER